MPDRKRHLWQEAVSFAARAHMGQLRKDGKTPYVAHVYRVALIVRHLFGCEDEVALISALLHDTIEDTTTDYDDIAEHFGDEIADCVAALSKNMLLREDMRERDYDERLAQGPWQARLVKLADVYDNSLDEARPGVQSRVADRRARALQLAQADAHRREFQRAIELVGALDA